MKTIKTTIALLALSIFTISCSKEENINDTNIPNIINDNFIRAKVDGVNYEVLGNKIYSYKYANGFIIRFDGAYNNTGIDMDFRGEPTVKTYNISSANFIEIGRIVFKNPEIYSSGFCDSSAGTLVITSKIGNTIQGTFAFTGKKLFYCNQAAKNITNGTFKVTFQQ